MNRRGRPAGLARWTSEDRPRVGATLVPGQIWYQLRLTVRNPLGAFVTLVIPVMLLVALDLVTPEMTLQSLGNVPVVQFLTPTMAAFAVLNVGFVDTIVGTTLAREKGVLKRLHATPLPRWTYSAGRLGSAVIVATCSVVAVLAVGVVFFHAHIAAASLAPFAASAVAGLVATFARSAPRLQASSLRAKRRLRRLSHSIPPVRAS